MSEHSRGTRSQVLFTLGLMWILLAIGITQSPGDRNPALLHTHLPVAVRALIWGGPGVFALVAVWWRRVDATAWALLMIPPFERFLSYLFGWAFADLFGAPSYRLGWLGALIYGALTFLVNRCGKGLDRPPSLPLLKE